MVPCAGVHRKPVGMCGLCFQHVYTYVSEGEGLACPDILGKGAYPSLFQTLTSSIEPNVEHPLSKEPCAEGIIHLGSYRGLEIQGCHISLAGKLVSLGMAGTPTPIRP